MNIFVLDPDPVIAAQQQCDKHVVKMILESAQMLSTAHRMLDGDIIRGPSKSGKTTVKKYILNDEREDLLYKTVHMNHPCTVWTRECSANYLWHYEHFIALCDEYRYRYGRVHTTDTKLRSVLAQAPNNIRQTDTMTQMALAMYDECKIKGNIVESYRKYYQTKQERFKMRWTGRDIPRWFHFHSEECTA